MEYFIRNVENSDIDEVLSVYKPYILNTPISFEYGVPTSAAFTQRVRDISSQYPFWVAIAGNKVVGYAYASRFRSREAYNWCAETTVYLHPDYQKKRNL